MTEDLRLQLLPLELIAYGASDTLGDVGGGLVTRVVRRGPDGVSPVPRDEAAGIAGGDPFTVAAEQTFRQELGDLDVRDHEAAGVRFRMLAIDGSPLVTTALIWADVTADLPGISDALVCAPRLSAVLVRPIRAQAEIGMAMTMASVAAIAIRDVPDPCTDAVFWWHRGRFHAIEIGPPGSQPILPAELGPVVEALPERWE